MNFLKILQFPFLKKIVVWDGVARHDIHLFSGCDIVLSVLGSTVEFYKQHGFQSFFLQHGFEASLLEKLNLGHQNINCSFIGSAGIASHKHRNRLELLSYLSKNIPLELHIASLPNRVALIKRNVKKLLNLDTEELFKIDDFLGVNRLNSMNKENIFGMSMYQLLANSKITLNMHIETAGNFCGNMRMFEATGVGSCLITDWKENLKDYFDIDTEVVTYKTKEECLEKVKFLLNNPKIRSEIAHKGQQRTMRDHTLERIIGDFAKVLLNCVEII